VGSVDRLFARAFFARAPAREQGLAVLLDGPIFSAASGGKKKEKHGLGEFWESRFLQCETVFYCRSRSGIEY
jgi:hypothetical protein